MAAELREAGWKGREMRYEIDRKGYAPRVRHTGTAAAHQATAPHPSPLAASPPVRAAAKKELEGRIAGVDLTQMECENTKVREMEVKVKEVEEGRRREVERLQAKLTWYVLHRHTPLSHAHTDTFPSPHPSPLTPTLPLQVYGQPAPYRGDRE